MMDELEQRAWLHGHIAIAVDGDARRTCTPTLGDDLCSTKSGEHKGCMAITDHGYLCVGYVPGDLPGFCQRHRHYGRLGKAIRVPSRDDWLASLGPCNTYFIGYGDRIKIGKSVNVIRRLAEIQRMSPVQLTLLLEVRGDFESLLHAKFAYVRSHGEWFRATPALRRLVESGESAVHDLEFEHLKGQGLCSEAGGWE